MNLRHINCTFWLSRHVTQDIFFTLKMEVSHAFRTSLFTYSHTGSPQQNMVCL